MNVLILSPVNPVRQDSGFKIAVWSDILAIRPCVSGLTVICSCLPVEQTTLPVCDEVRFELDAVKPGNRWLRFARALFSHLPAATERLYTTSMRAKIRHRLSTENFDLILIEDVSLAGWLSEIRILAPCALVILRSHNFMNEVTRLQFEGASALMKPVMYMEHLRWARLERRSVECADMVWTISDAERVYMTDFYDNENFCYAPVSIDIERYSSVGIQQGHKKWMAHLGTLDLKKAPGMLSFIERIWPRLKAYDPDLELHLGGKCTADMIPNTDAVVLHGYVEEDVDFYRNARFSINPQKIGAGVKLKSLVAMACGRVLVSTSIGVEGLDIEHGVHYINYEHLYEMNDFELFQDDQKLSALAQAGRTWVQAHHSRDVVADAIAALIEHCQKYIMNRKS